MTNDPQSQGPSFELGDIYYTLFRHKWRILLCSLGGIVLAFAYAKLNPVSYQSEAKLFVRYVVTEGKPLGGSGSGDTKTVDQSGETIMSSEREILTSRDLAEQVATNIGPKKILAKIGGGDDVGAAAAALQSGLLVYAPPRSSVIGLALKHRDPEVVQTALREFIVQYLKKHAEIHRAVGMVGDYLIQETDQLRARLTQTEEDLRKLMNQANITSLEESKKNYADQVARLRQQIFDTMAELAQRTSVMQEMTKGSAPASSEAVEYAPPTPEQVATYQKVATRLAMLQRREQDYLINFTEESARVREVRSQIQDAEQQKKKLETDHPALIKVPVVTVATSGQPATTFNAAAEAAQITSLQTKLKVLTSQLQEVRSEAAKVDQLETSIIELRRRKELEEENYRYYSANLEKSRINEALSVGRVSNITPIQNPTPPFKADAAKMLKRLGLIVVAGLGAGLAWAAMIEFYFDRTVRRPIDVERSLRIPLFLSIPRLGRREIRKLTNGALKELPAPKDNANPTAANGASTVATLGATDLLQPFHETLRDRLIGYFESKNLTHKPKLVAVTGLGRNSGVTTTAAGLARSLSETGDGNVLLVDMTAGQGSAQQFYQGTAVCGLDEILATRGNAQIQDNLYVVAEEPGTDKLSRILPHRFTKLIPKLKASDFDYIIFDMPPVSQISITPRLAGFMDMVLLVLESETTDKDLVQRATALLAESKAHVGAVLNKTRTYVPPSLHQESLGNT
jgi:succinoglycan biosynthesis transport protein ExoP